MFLFGKVDSAFCIGLRQGRVFCGEDAKFIISSIFAFMAFIADEALQKICMVGKEDETSPLLLEFIVFCFLIVPSVLIDLGGGS